MADTVIGTSMAITIAATNKLFFILETSYNPNLLIFFDM